MKNIKPIPTLIFLTFLISITLSSFAQTKQTSQIANPKTDSIDLILNLSVLEPYLAIGYASVYNCKINKMNKGSVEDTTISVTILAGETEKDSLFSKMIKQPKQIEVGFRMNGLNEPHGMMPINGFVDKNRTSWEIVYIKAID